MRTYARLLTMLLLCDGTPIVWLNSHSLRRIIYVICYLLTAYWGVALAWLKPRPLSAVATAHKASTRLRTWPPLNV